MSVTPAEGERTHRELPAGFKQGEAARDFAFARRAKRPMQLGNLGMPVLKVLSSAAPCR